MRTLLDDRHARRYAADRAVALGRPRRRRPASCPTASTACGSRCATRAAARRPARSIRQGHDAAAPARAVDRPARRRPGPSCCPSPTAAGARSTSARRSARARRSCVFRTAPGAPRAVPHRRPARRAARSATGTAPTAAGGASRRAPTWSSPEWRDAAGNIGTRVPLDRGGLPVLSHGRAARAAAASPSATSAPSRRSTPVEARRPRRRRRRRARQRYTLVDAPRRRAAPSRARRAQDAAAADLRARRAASRASTSSRRARAHARRRVRGPGPSAGRRAARQPRGVLVVLPSSPGRARNPVDDDGDGAPNTLDLGVPVRRVRVMAGDGLPAGFAEREAPRAALAGPHRHRATTSRPTSRWRSGRGPQLAGPPRRADRRRRALAAGRACGARCARFVRARRHGRLARHRLPAPHGARSTPRARLVDPSPAAPTDLFGARLAPGRARARTDLRALHRRPEVDLFAGRRTGCFPGVDAWEETERAGAEADLRRQRGHRRPDRQRDVIVAARFGKGLVIRPGFPELRRRACRRRRPRRQRADGPDVDAPVPLIARRAAGRRRACSCPARAGARRRRSARWSSRRRC